MAKLISPAVSTQEIDLSFVPQAVSAIGAGLIGVADKGPAFIPTSINTMRQYRRAFGNESKDSFMGLAAKEYLTNQGQLTCVRILGQTTAGISADNGYAIMRSTRVGLTNAQLKFILRSTDTTVTAVRASVSNGNIVISRSYTGANVSQSARVSLYPSNSNYVGRVFPTNRIDVRTTGGVPANVGATYGLYVDTIVKDVSTSAMSRTSVAITNQLVGNAYRPAQTPVIVSQGYGPSGSASVYDLFKVVNVGSGNNTNFDVKIQISNLSFDDTRQYPSFVLSVRQFSDTDTSPAILESFQVTLNPDDQNYILKVIGDRYKQIVTNQGTPYIKTFGDWDNKSEYIRIANPLSTIQNFIGGLPTVPSNARPQGFHGFSVAGTLCGNGTYLPTVEYVDSQMKRTNRTDATATGDLSKRIRLGYDFTRMDSSFQERQVYFSTSRDSYSNYVTKGFYVKHSSTDRTPSSGTYHIADVSQNGSDVSSNLISGGLDSNVMIAIPMVAGMDGWMLNTNDTPQQQMMFGQQSTALNNAIDLFADADDIDVNMLSIPGVGSGNNGRQLSRLIDLCSERGDCFAVIDIAKASTLARNTLTDAINTSIADAISQAAGFDDSYAACYWPWIRMQDATTNQLIWVPPSVGAYYAIAYNDKVSYPWFAAAGFNRGLLDFATQARIKVNKDMRDALYGANINPIATIKDTVLVMGNKTTQKKTTELQSIDIRRGLISIKKLIASVAQYVLFDKNTIRSRDSLLAKTSPILQDMQSKQGLNAFRVVSSPSADDIARHVCPLVIYVQFTVTTEYIPVSMVITPTGVTF